MIARNSKKCFPLAFRIPYSKWLPVDTFAHRRFKAAKALCLVAFLLLSAPSAWGQKGEPPEGAWTVDATSKFSFSQAAYSNWREGGLNTVSLAAGLDAKARRHSEMWKQKHEVRLGYGIVSQDTLDFRKANDAVRLSSQLRYRGKGFFSQLNPTLATNLRTQFAPGRNYDKVPKPLSRRTTDTLETPVKVSGFFSPAVVTQSIGLTYDADSWFTQRVGVGLKQTVVLIERLRPLYYGEQSKQQDQPLRFEAGVESHTELNREVFKNVRLKSALDLFYAYNQLETPPDALWENTILLGVNEWLSVNLEGVMLYNMDVDDRPQFKETLSVGISYSLI